MSAFADGLDVDEEGFVPQLAPQVVQHVCSTRTMWSPGLTPES
jgi:hypothetical protein